MRCLCLLLVLFHVTACRDNVDIELRKYIDLHQLTGNPVNKHHHKLSDINSPKAQLGKLLFFSKSLSGDKSVACASCHHPFLGGDDDLSMSVGVASVDENILGPDRLAQNSEILVPRNSPTTFNSGLWTRRLFHDGRIERLNALNDQPAKISTPDEHFGDIDPKALSLLQAQAGFPVTSEHEMRADYRKKSSNEKLRTALASNLIETSLNKVKKEGNTAITWESLFREAYQEYDTSIQQLITFERVQELLAVYQQSQLFIDTPWKQYVEGNTGALNQQQKKGALLFFKPAKDGGAGCVSCHSSDFFTDEEFHVLAIPQIGFGKQLNGDDRGRYLRTGIIDDRYAFRTPGLLNVELTAPYGHNGAFQTLEEVIFHHINPEASLKNYDYQLGHLEQKNISTKHAKKWSEMGLMTLEKQLAQGTSKLTVSRINKEEIVAIKGFLTALTDPCLYKRSCLLPWVVLESDPNPDDLILHALIK